MEFLISTSYRTTGQSAIWRFDIDSGQLDLFRKDQYYKPGQRRKDFVYFGMVVAGSWLYCAGGTVLTILDMQGSLVERRELDFLHDVHDLNLIGGQLFCTNTGRDRIEVFDLDLDHNRTINLGDLPPFRRKRLAEKSAHSPDSLHANFVSSRDNRVFVTHSYTCERDRDRAIALTLRQKITHLFGHSQARNQGIALDWRAGKLLSSGGVVALDGERVVDGLYGAHDGVFFRDKFYANATHNIETWIFDSAFKPLKTIEYSDGMLIRGLCPVDDTTLLLGATRVDPGRTASSVYRSVMRTRGNDRFDDFSSVKIVDVETGKIVETLRFEPFQGVHPEVHKIIPFEPSAAPFASPSHARDSEAQP